jgi:hypothetical protein
MLKSIKARASAVALSCASIFAAAGSANAISATSNYTWFGPDVQTIEGCRGVWLKADVDDTLWPQISHTGWIQTRECVSGGAPLQMRGGRMKVQVEGWKNGGMCGRTVWNASTAPTTTFRWRYTPCPDGQGGNYHTRVKGRVLVSNVPFVEAEKGQQFSPTLWL